MIYSTEKLEVVFRVVLTLNVLAWTIHRFCLVLDCQKQETDAENGV